MNLEEIREQIDQLDSQIVELLTQRLALSSEVAEYKKANNLPIFHPEREAKVIEKVTTKTKPEYHIAMESIYNCIMEQSKQLQKQQLQD